MTGPAADDYRAAFTSTTGGVMTVEAGAITGEIELLCRPTPEGTHVAARYAGTSDWYTVTGSPVRARNDESTRDRLLEHLTTPGAVVEGNEKPVTLEGFAKARD